MLFRISNISRIEHRRLSVVALLCILVSCGGGGGGSGSEGSSEVLVAGFNGLDTIDKNDDNSWSLRWELISAKDVVYAIFSAKEGEEFNYDQPLQTTRQDIFQ